MALQDWAPKRRDHKAQVAAIEDLNDKRPRIVPVDDPHDTQRMTDRDLLLQVLDALQARDVEQQIASGLRPGPDPEAVALKSHELDELAKWILAINHPNIKALGAAILATKGKLETDNDVADALCDWAAKQLTKKEPAP